MKILFLLKKNYNYNQPNSNTKAAGLFNSATFVSDTLRNLGYKTFLEICVDGNEIDKYLTIHRPKICIIEAIWATPAKLIELTKIHKKVHFVIRIHSNAPFLANEGVAVAWIKEYSSIPRVSVSFNNCETIDDFNAIGIDGVYLPNIYSIKGQYHPHSDENMILRLLKYKVATAFCDDFFDIPQETINIGCFGAIRPLKNQFVQAMAAIGYANATNKQLYFHINSSRIEQKGESVLKNIRALFQNTNHTLVEHPWMTHEKLLNVIKSLDLTMQISLSESFNIITADAVSIGIPTIVSDEIKWMPNITKADSSTNINSIIKKINQALKFSDLFSDLSMEKLYDFNFKAIEKWVEFIEEENCIW